MSTTTSTNTEERDNADLELKARHRAMWTAGDYPLMVETFLLPLGPRLVGAAGIDAGHRVLDVASGTGNAAIVAARTGANVTASDLTPSLLDAGRRRAAEQGVTLAWTEADAEHLPFEDGAFDVVMSSIGVMFAPHHEAAAAELVRVCRPGGTIALLSWTPEGVVGDLFRTFAPFNPPPPPGVQPPPLWGSEAHLDDLLGDRVDFVSHVREVLDIDAFESPAEFRDHFVGYYGPAIAARANAERSGREEEYDAALTALAEQRNLGAPDAASYEFEYLLSVGHRR